MWQSYFFIFRKLKSNAKCLFYKKHFYKQPQTEISETENRPFYRQLPYMDYTTPIPFLQENLDPPFYGFSKMSTL